MRNIGTIFAPLLMGLILVVGAGWQFYRAIIDWRFNRLRRSWPTTSGIITHSRVRYEAPYDDPIYSHAYTPDIHFRYTVEGRTYATIDFEDRAPDLEENVTRLVEQYPLGRIVVVHYDPAYPRSAYLDTGSAASIVRTLIIGVLALATGIFLIVVVLARL